MGMFDAQLVVQSVEGFAAVDSWVPAAIHQ
jgi:hypothetical protein